MAVPSWLTEVFGGGGGGTTTPINMNPLTGALAGPLSQYYSGLLKGGGAPQYNGPLQADMTGAQNTSLTNLAGMVQPGNNVNSWINDVLSGAYMPGGAKGNPFLQQTIQAGITPIQESLSTTLSQTDPTLFAAAGHNVQGTGSSAFQNAQALAVQSAANAESNVATQVANNAYSQGVQQMEAAAQLQPQEIQAGINVLQAQLLPTLLQEQGITNGLQAFQDNVQSLIGFIQAMTGATNPAVGTQGTTNPTQGGIVPGIAAMFKGGSGGGNGGAVMMPGGGSSPSA